MKCKLFLTGCLLATGVLQAQLPEDALRMTWTVPSGTARQQAIGGAMGSLGGEISALFVNPAGLGLFKTSEFVLSPGFNLLGGKGNFRGTSAKADNFSQFNYGTSGFVWGYSDRYSRWTSKAFSLAVNRTATFNSSSYYKGQNDYSSFAEPLANEFANSNLTIDQALNSNDISLLTKMALYTYLVDTATINGNTQVVARSENPALLDQEKRVKTTGGITEISLGFAANMDDKFYIGASIGVPVVNYNNTTTFKESDATGMTGNEFNYSTYTETQTSRGVGVNAKLGVIFKPAQQFRLGLAIHTPTLFGLKDKLQYEMTTDIEDKSGGNPVLYTVRSDVFYNGQNPEIKYDLTTPWKFLLSGSYVLHENQDITQQKGFITADIEYVGHRSSRFSSSDNYNPGAYYDDLNAAVKSVYKGAFNFRAGGELKFKTIMARLGFAWYGNPYEDAALKARRMNLSGGLGYRNKGFFVDLTYVHSLVKDVNFPYRVDAPRLNTFAELNNRTGTVLLTFGIKY